MTIDERVAITQATLDRWKDRPFAWGTADCAKLVVSHLREMGVRPKLVKAGTYKTAIGAKGALKRMGFGSLSAAMDAHFPRVPPAAAIVGDVVELPGDEGFGSLTIALGGGRVLGWHEDAAGAAVLQPAEWEAAWRVG